MFKFFHSTPALGYLFHSLIALVVGAITAGLTAAGQAAFNTGSNLQMIAGFGVTAFLVSLGHSFVALRSNPQTQQALSDLAGEIKIPPALLTDFENFAKQLAPFLAGELMKIKTPPVSALQGQQPGRTNQQVQQPSQQNRPSQPAVNNPTGQFQGNQSSYPNPVQSVQYGGGGYATGTAPAPAAEFWNLATQSEQPVPQQYQRGG